MVEAKSNNNEYEGLSPQELMEALRGVYFMIPRVEDISLIQEGNHILSEALDGLKKGESSVLDSNDLFGQGYMQKIHDTSKRRKRSQHKKIAVMKHKALMRQTKISSIFRHTLSKRFETMYGFGEYLGSQIPTPYLSFTAEQMFTEEMIARGGLFSSDSAAELESLAYRAQESKFRYIASKPDIAIEQVVPQNIFMQKWHRQYFATHKRTL